MKDIKFISIIVIVFAVLFLGFYFKDKLPSIFYKEKTFEAEQLIDIQTMTSDSIDISYHSWSPDGKQIVFETYNKDNDIWVMDVEKKELKRLTGPEGHDSQPMWSPDGKQIAFVSSRTGNGEIWIINNDGSNQKQLTKNNIKGSKSYPAWSHDGKKIVYSLSKFNTSLEGQTFYGGIWSMNSDGSDQKELMGNIKGAENPSWSPDGKKISFQVATVETYDPTYEFWIMGSDDNEQIPLTKIEIEEGQSIQKKYWFPDSNKIFFQLYDGNPLADADNSIWTVDSNGSNRQKLTADNEDIADFNLSPDGKKIAYITDITERNIWIMDSDGSNKKQLIANSIAYSLSWGPDSRTISFARNAEIWIIKIK